MLTTPLEKTVEKKVCAYARSQGVLVYKFTSPQHGAVPDDLFILPNGNIFFIEFKRQGFKATIPQQREHAKLQGHNVAVYVVDNIDIGIELINAYVRFNHAHTD